jgi:hypothetical protein
MPRWSSRALAFARGVLVLLVFIVAADATVASARPSTRHDARMSERRAQHASRDARHFALVARRHQARLARAAAAASKRTPPKPKPTPTPTPSPVPTPSPTPTPTPSPTSPPASDASSFGFAVGGAIQSEDATTLGRDLDSLSAARSRWIRFDINWAQVQAGGPTSYNWVALDRVVTGATSRGMKVLGGILYTPSWARPAGTSATYGPDPAQYAAFAEAAVQHFSALGVHAYEVWNEPNAGFWTPKPNVAAYTSLLKAAYPAIKRADPSAVVVTGGTSPAPSDGTTVSPVDWLKGIYANGGKGFFDAVGHHPYCAPAYPGDAKDWSAWYQMIGAPTSLRTVMSDNGDADKQIWATEYGVPTNGPSGSYVSESVQTDMLKRAWSVWRSYSWAGPLMWYAGRDQGTSTDTRENFYGLLRYDFSPKPAYTELKTLAAG